MTELGLVDGVRVENKEILVNVFVGPGRTPEDVPFVSPMQGLWIIPEIGQVVEVYEIGPDNFAARLPHSTPDYDIPNGLVPGDFALKTDSGTSIIVKKDGDIDIDASSDVTIDSNGNVVINGGTKGVIHDLSLTTDADGHVTDVTIERRDDILI